MSAVAYVSIHSNKGYLFMKKFFIILIVIVSGFFTGELRAEGDSASIKVEILTSLNGLELRIAQLGFTAEFPTKKYQTARNFLMLDGAVFQIVLVSKAEFLTEKKGDPLIQYKKWEQAHHTEITHNTAQFKDVAGCKNKIYKTISWQMKNPAITSYDTVITGFDMGSGILNVSYNYSNEQERKQAQNKMDFFCHSIKKLT
jgi:hypothetical protein